MTRDQILALEQRRFKAMCAGDVGALDQLLHRDLKYTHSSGAVDSKASYLRGVGEKHDRPEQGDPQEERPDPGLVRPAVREGTEVVRQPGGPAEWGASVTVHDARTGQAVVRVGDVATETILGFPWMPWSAMAP